eukprot:1188317-Karenia_brevis.AAC.1
MSNSHVNPKTQIWYTSVLPVFAGLATLPCHGLVNTGAQDVPKSFEAGGIGGAAKPVAFADMLMGVA